MSNYTKATNFASKDSLPTGNAGKIVKGTEIDDEFNAIATAVATKADLASPTFTGTPSAPTAASGTNTTQIATTAFVQAVGGRLVQSVASVFSSSYSVNSSTFTATGHSASITPTSTASKILVMVMGGDNFNNNTNTGINNRATIYRGSTNLSGSSTVGLQNQSLGAEYGFDWANSMVYLDSPSSTSSLTYEVYIQGNFNYRTTFAKPVMILLEIL
jgi:hypothetical protein